MKHKNAIIAAMVIAWLSMTIFIVRVAIPALVNIQNDGALILAMVVGIGWPILSYFAYYFAKDVFE